MQKLVKRGNLIMLIDRRPDSIRSQRLVNTILNAKRNNFNITYNELSYVAFGFQESGRG